MFKHPSKYPGFVAATLAVCLSTAVVAADEVASPATEVAFAATVLPVATAPSNRSAEVTAESDRSCRPIRRLGGKVKIQRHSEDCAE